MPNQKYSIGVRRVELVNASDNALKVDSITRAITTIPYEHHEIHDENMFEVSVIDAAMADNASINICFKTQDSTKWVHVLPQFSTKVGGNLRIIENATWTASTGTMDVVYNKNRNATKTSTIEINASQLSFFANNKVQTNIASVEIGGGSVIHEAYVFGSKQSGGGIRGTDEFILKQDTKYAFVFKADGATNGGEIILTWYEHTNNTN